MIGLASSTDRFEQSWAWRLPVFSVLLLANCQILVARAHADAPSIDQLKHAADSQRDAIRTLRVRENETVDVAEPLNYSEASDREYIVNALRPEQQGRIDVDGMVAVRRLNRHLTAEVVRTIDRQASKALIVVDDVRDLVALARTHALSVSAANNLDQSQTVVLEGANHTVMPAGHRSAVVRHEGPGELRQYMDLERLGIIPTWVFHEAFSLELSSDGESTFRLVGRSRSRRAFEVVLDGTKGYRVTSVVRFDDQDRPTESWTYSDYQHVGEVWIPRLVEAHMNQSGITDFQVSRWQILETEINPPLPPDTFDIPEGYHVQYLPGTRSPG